MSTLDPQQPPATNYGSSGPSGPRASFGRRLVAYLIDITIIGILSGIVYAISKPLGNVAGILVYLVYFTFFDGSARGQTIGMMALGIRVIDFRGGGPIGFGRGFIRWLGRVVSTIPCFLGYFWALWDKENQGWHDKIATTVVVPVSDYPLDKS
jgi:uncharacterized RDD family membrane protein YckC